MRAVVEAIQIPVVAIGGITAKNVRAVCQSGVRYAAVIADINSAPDVDTGFKKLAELTKNRFILT